MIALICLLIGLVLGFCLGGVAAFLYWRDIVIRARGQAASFWKLLEVERGRNNA